MAWFTDFDKGQSSIASSGRIGSSHDAFRLIAPFRTPRRFTLMNARTGFLVELDPLDKSRFHAANSNLGGPTRRGRTNLEFSPADVGAYGAAGILSALLAVVEPRLNKQERRYLQIASAAKLLELSLNRAYQVDADDCLCLARACCNTGKTDNPHLRYLRGEVSAKLLMEGRVGEMRLLSRSCSRHSTLVPVAEAFYRLVEKPLAGHPKGNGTNGC